MVSTKSLLYLSYAFHAIIVFSEKVQFLLMIDKVPAQVPGKKDDTPCAISSDGKTVVVGTPWYNIGYTGVNMDMDVCKSMIMIKVSGIKRVWMRCLYVIR